ncbi:tyrosine-type recombinase/integrase [Actinopolyspora mortivallis]|uniref:tyrosine-type recombinase/integrase n=1 Tax=Actinopolyspora mortivallis TaxID=33906 RepID=UPI003CCBFC45
MVPRTSRAFVEHPSAPRRRGDGSLRRDRWNPVVQEAGLDGLTPHDLRHTYASWLLRRGVTVEQVSELLGHSTITMTQRYAHLADTQWEAVRAALDGNEDNVRGEAATHGHRSRPSLGDRPGLPSRVNGTMTVASPAGLEPAT